MERLECGLLKRVVLAAMLAMPGAAVHADPLQSLTICADPGNMPLSNQRGEGFENKIAEVIGNALGIGVNYYWRPSVERGLMRTTLSEGNCQVWMDMATDTEGAVVLSPPLYRSTFVLVTRADRNLQFRNFNDPQLKKLRVGVYQVSAIREALANHGVTGNTVVQYLSHNGDMVANNQPSYQVQQVADGQLDVAAVWGPMAGYYKSIKKEPLSIQPVNLMEDATPLEFSLSLAVPRGRPDIKSAVEGALRQHAQEVRQILVDFGVPLVKCSECLIDGDLPSHGPYIEQKPDPKVVAMEEREAAQAQAARMADLKATLAHGGNANDELQNAITASDVQRVRYTLMHGARVDSTDGDGNTPLSNATRLGFNRVAIELLDRKANPNTADRGSWTPLMYAAYNDNDTMIKALLEHGADLTLRDSNELTALAIAAQNGKAKAVNSLLAAGANVNAQVARGGYTPLMLTAIGGSSEVANALISHGAQVNAANPGGVTALMIATANDNSGMVELLLKSGANVDARSDDGRTALTIAQSKNNETLEKLLQGAAQTHANKTT